MKQKAATRQARKRLVTRQTISDAATALFLKHGFDSVTIDEIAEAADVARMTVFNHFARKEDMFFDQEESMRVGLAKALADAPPGESAIESIRLFLHRAFGAHGPQRGALDANGRRFMQTVQDSEALSNRWRSMHEEWTDILAEALASSASKPVSRLAAAIMLTSWTTALAEAHRQFGQGQSAEKARKLLFRLIDKGAAAAELVLKA